jgi:phosphoribosylglycinamide formyltransferase-1
VTRIGVLISGRGSNMVALVRAASAGRLGAEIAVVVSNVPGAPGLERARAEGVPAVACPSQGRGREEHEAELTRILEEQRVGLVCLAGYMRLLSPAFVRRWAGRILNVHPSLLPAFPGLEAQRQAFDHGVKVSGATVHLVGEGLDDGPIVLQEAVPVLEDDGPEQLAARILEAEHRIYPEAVRRFCTGRLRVDGRRVRCGAPA